MLGSTVRACVQAKANQLTWTYCATLRSLLQLTLLSGKAAHNIQVRAYTEHALPLPCTDVLSSECIARAVVVRVHCCLFCTASYTHLYIHREGDHRTAEGLVSGAGAMVMVDRMWSPQPFPLVHQHHIVSYDIGDEKTFFKLHYYSTHEQAARIIAARGLYHALRFMSPVTTVDYVLCTAEQLNG
eukprot:19203-Heterococcus_DN1.PRE.1